MYSEYSGVNLSLLHFILINFTTLEDSKSTEEFYELSYYTLGHKDMGYFTHQHIVNAYQAQTADKDTKPIAITFALVGLYLYLEKGYSGRQVQLAHMRIAENKKIWPDFDLPQDRGRINISDVLHVEPGDQRDWLIKEWCQSVWASYVNCYKVVEDLACIELGI